MQNFTNTNFVINHIKKLCNTDGYASNADGFNKPKRKSRRIICEK